MDNVMMTDIYPYLREDAIKSRFANILAALETIKDTDAIGMLVDVAETGSRQVDILSELDKVELILAETVSKVREHSPITGKGSVRFSSLTDNGQHGVIRLGLEVKVAGRSDLARVDRIDWDEETDEDFVVLSLKDGSTVHENPDRVMVVL